MTTPPSDTTAFPVGRVSLEQEMRKSYIDYSMSVIVSRALPDVRDGLKPVHRRILYGAKAGGFGSDKRFVKSAKIVGEVMGNYHPHGDSAIYDSMVRMAQPFSMRVPLIQGQGNFGSPDGDPPAAMRYTEARTAKITDDALVSDLDEDTVDWRPNYDGSQKEPVVLPARFPNILVNGGSGIAVGMATNIAPHNLGEVIDGALAVLANPNVGLDEILRIIPGPDFPTGGVILGFSGIRDAAATGRGMITVSGVYGIEQHRGGRQSIIITELPYQVNKNEMIKKLAELVNAKTIEGISDLRDESDKEVRVVIDLKRDATPDLVINKLKKHTDFVTRFGVNATCLDSHGMPVVMGLLDILKEFTHFRRQVVRRRTEYRINKARDILMMQVGLFAARGHIDEVVRRIRAAHDRDEARLSLMNMDFPCEGELAVLLHEVDPDIDLPPVFKLSESQARAILELRLQTLTALEQDNIVAKARELLGIISELDKILRNKDVLDRVIHDELVEIKEKYSTPRLTRIDVGEHGEIDEEDLIDDRPVVLTMTHNGYVKITALDSYREQSRGGKGKTGMDTKDDDFVVSTLVCSTKTNLLFFTTRGIAHTIKAYKLPETAANARGRPLINFIQLRQDETVATVMPVPSGNEAENKSLIFVTDHGDVRRNQASEFASVNRGGKIAMRLEDDNGVQLARLIAVLGCDDNDDIALATRWGKAARFPVTELRVFKGRSSTGVTGLKLASGDTVVSACILRHFDATSHERDAYLNGGSVKYRDENGIENILTLTSERNAQFQSKEQSLLTITSNGYGKRFSSYDFRTTGRGAHGVWSGQFTSATGYLVALLPVETADGLILVTNGGQSIRTRCSEIRVMGRTTRGVKVFDLPADQYIVDVARVPSED